MIFCGICLNDLIPPKRWAMLAHIFKHLRNLHWQVHHVQVVGPCACLYVSVSVCSILLAQEPVNEVAQIGECNHYERATVT